MFLSFLVVFFVVFLVVSKSGFYQLYLLLVTVSTLIVLPWKMIREVFFLNLNVVFVCFYFWYLLLVTVSTLIVLPWKMIKLQVNRLALELNMESP